MKSRSAPLSPRLSIYRWRIGMIASIAHRASGLALVLFVPFYLWMLHGMTGTPDDFQTSLAQLHSPLGRLTLWIAGSSIFYHICNGIRFLGMDIGWWDHATGIRTSARIVVTLAIMASLLLAVILW